MRSIAFFALLFLTVGVYSVAASDMNIIGRFELFVEEERWDDALPLIEDIVQRNPNISTSWRNYGVVLDALERHAEAAKAFARAYELSPDDYGTQYRVFRSLALANDVDGFIAFAKQEAQKDPEILDLIANADEFSNVTATKAFQQLHSKARR